MKKKINAPGRSGQNALELGVLASGNTQMIEFLETGSIVLFRVESAKVLPEGKIAWTTHDPNLWCNGVGGHRLLQ